MKKLSGRVVVSTCIGAIVYCMGAFKISRHVVSALGPSIAVATKHHKVSSNCVIANYL